MATREKRRQVTTTMLPSLYQRLKAQAALDGLTIADALEELVKEYIDRSNRKTEPPSG